MAAKAIRMEKLKQILRLKQEGLSIKAIVRLTGISRPTVKKYLSRIKDTGIDERDVATCSGKELAQTAFDTDSTECKGIRYQQLVTHFVYAETELKKTGVTRQL